MRLSEPVDRGGRPRILPPTAKKPFGGRNTRICRALRCVSDFVVLLLVVEVSMTFVDIAHPFVAVLFTLASAAGALRQMTAWRAGQLRQRAASQSAWAFIAVALWLAATYSASHQLFRGHLPQMPLSVQAVGAICLIFAIAIPFLRIPQLTHNAFNMCPHAIGAVLLTGSPILAILVGAWLAATCHTAWQTLRVPHLLQPRLDEHAIPVRYAA